MADLDGCSRCDKSFKGVCGAWRYECSHCGNYFCRDHVYWSPLRSETCCWNPANYICLVCNDVDTSIRTPLTDGEGYRTTFSS